MKEIFALVKFGFSAEYASRISLEKRRIYYHMYLDYLAAMRGEGQTS